MASCTILQYYNFSSDTCKFDSNFYKKMKTQAITELLKLSIEDNESDIIRFAFASNHKKLRASKSFLSKISPVFEKMFSDTWNKESTIELSDDVTFNQYTIFHYFLIIIYEICEVNRLRTHRLIAAYYYAHKYEVSIAKSKIETELANRMNQKLLCVENLYRFYEFSELYQLDELKEKLDNAKLALDSHNSHTFFEAAVKLQLNTLKQQVIEYSQTTEPNDSWPLEMYDSVLRSLQKMKKIKPKKR